MGTYTVIYTATDLYDNEAETKYRTVIVIDKILPVITIAEGYNPHTIQQISTASEYTNIIGVTANDNTDGPIPVTIISSNVSKTEIGTYSVLYEASDSFGNTTSMYRTVVVDDKTTPIFIYNDIHQSNNYEYNYTLEYSLSNHNITDNVRITDNQDDNITSYITRVNQNLQNFVPLSLVGEYTIEHTYSDDGNNSATLNGIITVQDTKYPTITIDNDLGEIHTVDYSSQDIYQISSATANDLVDGDLSVTITGNVQLSQLGSYTVTYKSTDLNQNSTTIYRTVVVKDNQPPSITLKKLDKQIYTIAQQPDNSYSTLGVVVEDNYDSIENIIITFDSNGFNY